MTSPNPHPDLPRDQWDPLAACHWWLAHQCLNALTPSPSQGQARSTPSPWQGEGRGEGSSTRETSLPLRPPDLLRRQWGPLAWRTLLPATVAAGDEAAAQARWTPDRPGDYCGRCGASVSAAAVTITGCPHCRDRRIAWHNLWRLGAYHAPLSEWVIALKFHRAWAWGDWFGRQLAYATPDHPRALVTPVPLHWRRRLRRGYDQAALIARAFAAEKNLAVAPLLRRRRATLAQTNLQNRDQRRRNVRDAFRISHVDLTGSTVWLVDDVTTTGATAHVCTRLLRRAGAERVNVIVAAVADPRRGDFQRT